MLFSHSSQLLTSPPAVGRHLVGHWHHRGPDVADTTRPVLERATARLPQRPESEFPEITAWRRAFSQMGLKPTQYRCASEALLRRFRKDGSLPSIHPLVDVCNAVSLAYAN
jgi:DNA/RNA-binding domain of Phe-tRNA-synthetase-like protein